jgi:hypothetical protein
LRGGNWWAHPLSAKLSKIAQISLSLIVAVPLVFLLDLLDVRLVRSGRVSLGLAIDL